MTVTIGDTSAGKSGSRQPGRQAGSREPAVSQAENLNGDIALTKTQYDEIVAVVKNKLDWNITRYPQLRYGRSSYEDALAVGVAAVWQSLVEDDLDWDSLGRIERLNLAAPAVNYLKSVVRSQSISKRQADSQGGVVTRRYVYDAFVHEGEDFELTNTWFDSGRFASASAEDVALADSYEAVEMTDETINELFGTPGAEWSATQRAVIEALAYHRGTTVDMGRHVFANHDGRSTPENMFTSTQRQIKQKIARHRAAQEA